MAQWPVLGSAVPTRGPNRITLSPGQVYLLGPGAGVYAVRANNYISLQQYDPISGIWVKVGGGLDSGGFQLFYSDGVNYRLANQTGAAIGALLTNAGSGYTSVPTVTASAGASIWRAIVGGAVSTSVTVTAAGQNYTYPPVVLFSAPPPGGVQASGYSTLSGSGIASVTMDNQGAGYFTPPQITFVNDPREVSSPTLSDGYGASAVCTLTGSQTVTALLCTDHGLGGLTALPTLTFSGGGGSGAAATTIMCWSITAYAVTTAGTGWTTAPQITAYDNFPITASAYLNPQTQKGIIATNPAQIIGAVTAGGITATGQIIVNGGIYTSVPTILIQNTGILITAAAALTATMGGQNGTAYIQQL